MRVAARIGLGLVVAACSLVPVPPAGREHDYDVRVSNGTALELTVLLNGMVFAAVEPGGSTVIPAAGKPARPWLLNVLTSEGRSLVTLDVLDSSVGCDDSPDGSLACRGAIRVLDLSCGRLVLAVTPIPPSLPAPLPGAGTPGDCEP